MCNVYCLCSSQTEFCWIGLFAFGLVCLPMIKKLICIILVANDLLELNLFAFGLMCSLKLRRLKLVGFDLKRQQVSGFFYSLVFRIMTS